MNERDAEILRLLEGGMRQCEIMRQCGYSRSLISGVVYRHRNPTPPPTKKPRSEHLHTWSEENLTEPWVEYTARRRAERAAAHP